MYATVGEGRNQVHLGTIDGAVARSVDTGAEFEYVAMLGEEWDNFVQAVNQLDTMIKASEELFNG